MQKEFSIYLDLVRFVAAVMVLLSHSNVRKVIAEPLSLSDQGHAAVIVFFILSGYVISYITAEREKTPIDYWSSRLSRFYSLVIPVVLLTPLLDVIGESIAPQFYVGKTTNDLAWVRILSSLTYLNEVWHISIMSFSNVPFWSLCYEMWYYVLFAVVAFTRGRTRYALLAAVALVVGPKILMLAPIWMFGVVLHRSNTLARLSEASCWALFLGSVALYLAFDHYQMTAYGDGLMRNLVGEKWFRTLTFSQHVIGDYPLALIIAANFVGFRGIAHRFGWLLLPAEAPIRWVAGLTFSLYIMHQPLLQFFAALIRGDNSTPVFYFQVLACTFVTIAVVGRFTEQKRHVLKRWIKHALKRLDAWWQQRQAASVAAAPDSVR